MNPYPLFPLKRRAWRMLSVRWQREPLASGSHLTGGRWNAVGTEALYLACDHSTAIMEYYRSLVRPGTLAAYEVDAIAIADLTDRKALRSAGISPAVLDCDWQTLHAIDSKTPPSWTLAKELIRQGAEGALVPSVQHVGGTNLVLWRWGEGGGAKVKLIDPEGDLG